MSFKAKNLGEWKLRYYKKTATTAFTNQSLVDWPASITGYFVAATSTTTKPCGILQRAVTSSSSDYGDNSLCPVLVPMTLDATVVATTAGTAVATDVGGRYDLTDAVTVNRAASIIGRVVMTKFLSATSCEYNILPIAIYAAAA